MKLAPFLIASRPMHPEHAEHHRRHVTVRLEPHQMARITVVVRCRGVGRLRVRISMLLMRIAGRIGGFRRVKLVHEHDAPPSAS